MKLFKEPIDVDFSMRSEPWNEEDLAEFRILMNKLKAKNAKQLKKKRTKKAIKSNQPG